MSDPVPLGYAIAEQRPCRDRFWNDGTERLPEGWCWSGDLDRCRGCNGDGTRWVVTDTRVEPVQHYCERGDDEDAYSEDVRCDPDRADYWLRVRS